MWAHFFVVTSSSYHAVKVNSFPYLFPPKWLTFPHGIKGHVKYYIFIVFFFPVTLLCLKQQKRYTSGGNGEEDKYMLNILFI